MATHFSILAWESYEQKSPVAYSPWSHKRVRHNLETKQQYLGTSLHTIFAKIHKHVLCLQGQTCSFEHHLFLQPLLLNSRLKYSCLWICPALFIPTCPMAWPSLFRLTGFRKQLFGKLPLIPDCLGITSYRGMGQSGLSPRGGSWSNSVPRPLCNLG